jgi:hypothetical protein
VALLIGAGRKAASIVTEPIERDAPGATADAAP